MYNNCLRQATQSSNKHISLGIADHRLSFPFPVTIGLLLECGTGSPFLLLGCANVCELYWGGGGSWSWSWSLTAQLPFLKYQDHVRFLCTRFQKSSEKNDLWHFKGSFSLVVGYYEKLEAKYSPQAHWVPALLSHKHISEPEGTSKRRDMFAELSWM